VIPILEPVIRELGNAGQAFNDLDADVQTLITLFTGPFGIASIAVINALTDIIPSVDDVKTAFNNLKDDASAAISGIQTAVSNEVQPITNAFSSITTKAKNVLSYLTETGANSLVGDVESQLSSVKNTVDNKKSQITSAFGNVADEAEGVFNYLTGKGDGPSLESDITDSLISIANKVKNLAPELNFAFDEVVLAIENALDIDTTGITDPLDKLMNKVDDALDDLERITGLDLSAEIEIIQDFILEVQTAVDGLIDLQREFQRSGGDPDDAFASSNPSRPAPDPETDDGDGFVGAATGGVVESTGGAVLHEGERVVPAAQVADRGPAPIKNDGVTVNINNLSASSRAEGRQAARGLKDELKRFDI